MKTKVPHIRKDGTICWKCGHCQQWLTADSYYIDQANLNGLRACCKSCTSAGNKRRYRKDIEKSRAKSRAYRANNREMKAKHDKKYSQSEAGRVVIVRASNKWAENNPAAKKAHRAVDHGKRMGSLITQPCEICGTEDDINAHHDDYSKPLNVRWLCRNHHREHHINERFLANGGAI